MFVALCAVAHVPAQPRSRGDTTADRAAAIDQAAIMIDAAGRYGAADLPHLSEVAGVRLARIVAPEVAIAS